MTLWFTKNTEIVHKYLQVTLSLLTKAQLLKFLLQLVSI